MTVVVDHDSGRLVWAATGRDEATLRGFFDILGADRSAEITHVSADAADWFAQVVAERCPNAVRCADPFHVVKWATEALDGSGGGPGTLPAARSIAAEPGVPAVPPEAQARPLRVVEKPRGPHR